MRTSRSTSPTSRALAPPAGPPLRPTLEQLGFTATNLAELRLPLGEAGAKQLLDDFVGRIDDYRATRDFPAVRGPSYLSVHLRFGTVSHPRTGAPRARARV